MQTVLVSGAGVAGVALAAQLRRHGVAVTVVERAPGLRPGGHAIDVRGVALDVLDRIGVLAEARRMRTRTRGMTMLDGDGEELWSSTEFALSSGPLGDGTDDVELLREDLVRLLYGRARDGVEYVFGDRVTALDQDDAAVHVAFECGAPRSFDVVVGADGLHSGVRRLAFGAEEEFLSPLGAQVAVYTAENFLGLEDWQVWCGEDDTTFCLYPVRGNSELRVTAGFAVPGTSGRDGTGGTSGTRVPGDRDTARQKAFVAERMGRLRWETPALLKAMDEAPDFYCDAMAQVHMDRWSRGRVTLLGDAGYCPSPLSGQGTSLALAGAHVLADEIATAGGGDPARALASYEERMRPFAEINQALATAHSGRGMPDGSAMDEAKNALSLD
ncbi:2-polyprenyl-6-methoxyphenol hydroxylase-like FAD-dependent oxidoreductase [Streptomyces sp. Amel2xB2]|uniref:FAD-dependent monooxygenase n=1 Tax=Streptomyces sp. Amel2xB2 TaxID=1305829 RepID=UPI000DBA03D0|nr:FAD-dependent monooxygenase [Streptomyces sp. Amel2xB2]RAJ70348.1 2-polyprenyl-6-methoxyphenol hydroxylase-like FAD-dependent oxidoreductase [Streptomyces sp. Amel2xB2]